MTSDMRDTGHILGFDYGERRIGIAVGENQTRTVHPLTTLPCRNGKPDWAAIRGLLEEWQPVRLIVGLPLHMDGKEQPMTKRAKRFGNQLQGRFGLPVSYADERLTSVEATQLLGPQGARDATATDKVAAQLILQGWLEQERTE